MRHSFLSAFPVSLATPRFSPSTPAPAHDSTLCLPYLGVKTLPRFFPLSTNHVGAVPYAYGTVFSLISFSFYSFPLCTEKHRGDTPYRTGVPKWKISKPQSPSTSSPEAKSPPKPRLRCNHVSRNGKRCRYGAVSQGNRFCKTHIRALNPADPILCAAVAEGPLVLSTWGVRCIFLR